MAAPARSLTHTLIVQLPIHHLRAVGPPPRRQLPRLRLHLRIPHEVLNPTSTRRESMKIFTRLIVWSSQLVMFVGSTTKRSLAVIDVCESSPLFCANITVGAVATCSVPTARTSITLCPTSATRNRCVSVSNAMKRSEVISEEVLRLLLVLNTFGGNVMMKRVIVPSAQKSSHSSFGNTTADSVVECAVRTVRIFARNSLLWAMLHRNECAVSAFRTSVLMRQHPLLVLPPATELPHHRVRAHRRLHLDCHPPRVPTLTQ
mmetsp:Transcript_41516/g.104709  ORF Transcript_41516/g.104709 Transcript_41516/m.104709 type:complete len:260 (+) Transcript_41516:238-1017(+)